METWSLSGRVLAEDAPAAGASVSVHQYPPKASGVLFTAPDAQCFTTCDADGRFQVAGMRPGFASVNVRLKGFLLGHAVVDRPGVETLIQLERGSSIRGRVESTGEVRRTVVRVLLEPEGGGMWETGLGTAGEFEVDGLPSGLYNVREEAEGVDLADPLQIRLEPKETRGLLLKVVR